MYRQLSAFKCRVCDKTDFTLDIRKRHIYAVCVSCGSTYNLTLRIRVN